MSEDQIQQMVRDAEAHAEKDRWVVWVARGSVSVSAHVVGSGCS